jgi:hypothetical protein
MRSEVLDIGVLAKKGLSLQLIATKAGIEVPFLTL